MKVKCSWLPIYLALGHCFVVKCFAEVSAWTTEENMVEEYVSYSFFITHIL